MSRGRKRTKTTTISMTYQDLARVWWIADLEDRPFSRVCKDALALGLPLLAKRKGIKIPTDLKSLDHAMKFLEDRTDSAQ
jgi:hypothetical protein